MLVVEDNELDSSQMIRMLENDNVELTIASTGKKAVEETRAQEFDCSILDYTLPDISGNELLNQIAASKKVTFRAAKELKEAV